MRNLKYLIFIIISLFSVQAFADGYYWVHQSYLTSNQGFLSFPNPNSFSSISAACNWLNGKSVISRGTAKLTNTEVLSNGDGKCTYTLSQQPSSVNTALVIRRGCSPDIPACAPPTCPKSGYPIPIYFDSNSPIPLRTCKQNPDGTYCITEWTGDKNRPIVISGNNYQSITHASVSEIPSPSCTPLFSQDTCNPSDPYGGCYKPPNDNCNRMSDGSIYCPPDEPPPPIKSGCQNGATYCDMPPTGCGTGYVPGTFNGKQICVKNSNPPPTDPPDQPPPASDPPSVDPPDPTDPPDGDPPPPPPPPPPSGNNDALLRAILDAINAVNNKLTWLKNELVNAISTVAKKIDVTNSKLDTVNSSIKETTAAVNASGDKIKAAVDANATTVKTAVEANTAATNGVKTAVEANTNSTANKLNEVVNAINNKPVGGGGSAPDMKPTNDLLTEIKNFLKEGPDKLENEKPLEVKNENVTDYDRQNHVVFGQYCPFSPEQTALPVAPGYEMTVSSDLTPICTFGEKARPIIQLIGHLGALLFVLAALRSKD
ncbi:virulence factor TspB C-terminal domain-related protein [Acinetobacter baumannii]|uniref:virulence factor TspB C-terminal domain-related protein n=1 Tax=Acinetobacter baumannii TaxID=470 RepID=UPI003EB6F03E